MGGNTIDIGAVVDAALQSYDRAHGQASPTASADPITQSVDEALATYDRAHGQTAPADPAEDLLASLPEPTPPPANPIVARATQAPDSGTTRQPANLFSPVDAIIARSQGTMARGGVGQPGTVPNLSDSNVATVRYQGQTLTFSANFANRRPAGAMPLANAGGPVRTPVVVTGNPPDEPAVPVAPIATRDIYVGGSRDAQSLAQAYFRDNPDALAQIREHLTQSPVH